VLRDGFAKPQSPQPQPLSFAKPSRAARRNRLTVSATNIEYRCKQGSRGSPVRAGIEVDYGMSRAACSEYDLPRPALNGKLIPGGALRRDKIT